MPGAQVTVDAAQLSGLLDGFSRLSDLDMLDLAENVASEIESQVRFRISTEKRAPQGFPWPEWSPRYARTRHANHSLLMSRGHLLDSIQSQVTEGRIEVGSPLVYAATHQYGRDIISFGEGDEARGGSIPARPYLGLSEQNQADIEALAADWLDMTFAAGFAEAAEE